MRCARCGREILAAESGRFFEEESAVPDDDGLGCPECAASPGQPTTGVLFATVPREPWMDDRIREIRLRQMAKRQGLALMKAPQWARHSGWGLYWPATVADTSGHGPGRLLVSPDVGLTLDGVEEFLTYGTTRAAIMEYLIRSYGKVFVEKLIKHLPQRRANASHLRQENG